MSQYWKIDHKGRLQIIKGEYNKDKKTNPELAALIMKEIIDSHLNPSSGQAPGGLAERMDELWKDCTLDQRTELSKILPDKGLSKHKAEMIVLRNKDLINSIKENTLNQCAKTVNDIRRIVFINKKDEQDMESRNGLLLYVSKHPNECCIVYSKEELEEVLVQKTASEVTLVLMGDNNRKDRRFLDWTLESAGEQIGLLVKNHECVSHVRLISCHAGAPNIDYMQQHRPADEKRNSNNDLSARTLFIHEPSRSALPYAEDTLAAQIWRAVIDNNTSRELSISASPNYLHLDDENKPAHFIGSDKGAPFGVTHQFEDMDSFTNLKTVTLSTLGGVKAKKILNVADEQSKFGSTITILQTLGHNTNSIPAVKKEKIINEKQKDLPLLNKENKVVNSVVENDQEQPQGIEPKF